MLWCLFKKESLLPFFTGHSVVRYLNLSNLSRAMKIKIPTKEFSKLSPEKARIIGHCIGDGAVYKTNTDYVIKYEVKDFFLIKQFHCDLIEVYGLEPHLVLNKSGKTGHPLISVRLRSKIVYNDLLRYVTSFYSDKWELKEPILNSPKSMKKELLRALYDDEGSIINNRYVRLYSINLNGLKQLGELIKEFEIKYKFEKGFGAKRNVHSLTIKDIEKFYTKIGFNLPRKKEGIERIFPII